METATRPTGYYLRQANKYIADVLSGKKPACKYVKQACQRQVDDLARSRDPAQKWRYKFDKAAAERVCMFAELMPHIKGEWAKRKEKLKLEPWQCFILTTIFGWVDKKSKRRRFRTTYKEIPRKNAKSTLSSAVALYMLCADGEAGAEVYAAATTKEQARIVFNDAKVMVDRTRDLKEVLGMETSKYAVFQNSTSSTFKPLVRDQDGNLDGLNVHMAVVDELHGHKDRGTWDVLDTATGARSQPLLWAITTAGFDRYGICYEQRSYAVKVLSGEIEDDTFFSVIYTIDQEDDWKDPAVWEKANPNWGVSVQPEKMHSAAIKAINTTTAQANFLTKHLNVWVNASSAWMNMAAWDECADPTLDEDEFEGMPALVAADLAYKNDFCAVAKVFVRKIDGQDHFFAFVDHYVNEVAAENNPTNDLPGWIEDGLVTVTPGAVTDFNRIEEDIIENCRRFKVADVAFDPFQAAQMQQNLDKVGITPIEYAMNLKNMSEPAKELEALILSKRFHHSGDPVLTWMMSNVVARLDAKGNIFPKKDEHAQHSKVDGVLALIMCIGRYIQAKPREREFQVIFI